MIPRALDQGGLRETVDVEGLLDHCQQQTQQDSKQAIPHLPHLHPWHLVVADWVVVAALDDAKSDLHGWGVDCLQRIPS
jgi:hypothetical protein